MNKITFLLITCFVIAAPISVAQDTISIPPTDTHQLASHCKSEETVFITARMQNVNRNLDNGVHYQLTPTKKFVSLCYTHDHLIYRYGAINRVEFEKTATRNTPFSHYHRKDGRMGKQVLFFSNGKYNYYIGRSLGMGSGISIDVFRDGVLLKELFSGTDSELDYFANDFTSDLPDGLVQAHTPKDTKMRSPNRISWIKRRYSEIREGLNDATKHTLDITDDSGHNGTAVFYERWGRVSLIELTFYGETGKTIYFFYNDTNMPFFVLKQNIAYNAPIYRSAENAAKASEEEGIHYEAFDSNKSTLSEWRYYYDGDFVSRVLNPQKESVKDIESARQVLELGQRSLNVFLEKKDKEKNSETTP